MQCADWTAVQCRPPGWRWTRIHGSVYNTSPGRLPNQEERDRSSSSSSPGKNLQSGKGGHGACGLSYVACARNDDAGRPPRRAGAARTYAHASAVIASSAAHMMQEEAMAAEVEMEEEQYVMAANRFFRVKPDVVTRRRRLHYLESCFLCKNPIAGDRDIFMYKGNAAFCSDDCRQDQMDMDEALDAVARRRHLLRSPAPPSSAALRGEAPSPMMRRRPTIANLAARTPPPVAAS